MEGPTCQEYIILAWEPSAAQITKLLDSRRLPALERFTGKLNFRY